MEKEEELMVKVLNLVLDYYPDILKNNDLNDKVSACMTLQNAVGTLFNAYKTVYSEEDFKNCIRQYNARTMTKEKDNIMKASHNWIEENIK